MSQLLSPTAAQVGFKIIYHTALVGDLERDMVAQPGARAGRMAAALG